ncbi:hypothetical protein J3F83DRAFT_722785 [Trichoderma novae-zelandiae]
MEGDLDRLQGWYGGLGAEYVERYVQSLGCGEPRQAAGRHADDTLPSCLTGPLSSVDQRGSQSTGQSNQSADSAKLPDPGPGWKFPRQTLKAQERGLCTVCSDCSSSVVLVLGFLFSGVCRCSWGFPLFFPVLALFFFILLFSLAGPLSWRVVSWPPVCRRRSWVGGKLGQ